MLPEALSVIQKITAVFTRLGIDYFIGGSFASALHGLPRATRDVDFIADFKTEQVAAFVMALEAEFYLDAKTIRSAITHERSFNVIHLETMFKADIFVLASTKWARHQFQQRILKPLQAEAPMQVWTCTAEDIVLQKLLWFEKGARVSRQQWDDVLGVIKINRQSLDYAYLEQWSSELDIAQLWQDVRADAGLEERE